VPVVAPTTAPAGPSNAEAVAIGAKEFSTCAGCHGADATGITGLGKNLVGSDFITGISDGDLATLIKTGRSSIPFPFRRHQASDLFKNYSPSREPIRCSQPSSCKL
jgi:mono/diheme cytochrome c family protein